MRVTITITGKGREVELVEALGPHVHGTTNKKLHEALDRAYKHAKQWIGEESV